jgi:ribosomal protein S18 acetylase RimI-like enzyme
MPLSIRAALDRDLQAVLDLDHRARFDPAQPAHMAEWLEPDGESWIRDWIAAGELHVAESDGRFVAYGVLHHHFFHDGMIDLVIVDRTARRLGVATALIEHLATLCRSDLLWISTNLSNQPMQALLAKLEFKMSGFIEGLDEGDPELVYRKVLRAPAA